MKRTIQKVLIELKSEKPDLSYIRGLLEGLVEDGDETTTLLVHKDFVPVVDKVLSNIKSDEETIPASVRPGPIAVLH